ncbi:MAG: low molecular weight protein arginine phosphatase [candidate division Zixibacteria bacterium]|nr:low molecular weight protein arginine phosphatase [candidate division Zixibacteria bacterium]MDH3938883.1 low molecular weight protein arginine phosphatase [candidate division Zixibacteria bacterium]MDH4033863.1 low molecular weight protein arginine phosphatase [candidate division Zixibacteria bacterium]
MSEKFVVLFVCTGNTCRSPMAEGALRSLLESKRPDKFEVISAGTIGASGYPATMYAVEAAKLRGADISSHQSQPLTNRLVDSVDLILGMTSSHVDQVLRLADDARSKTYLFKNFPDSDLQGEGVDDPIGQSLERYNETFLEIYEFLDRRLDEFVKLIDAKTDAETNA